MGVTKTITQEGSGAYPVKGQTVNMSYTGWKKNKDGSKGTLFDASKKDGFDTKIGVGRVIRGWDEAILTMKLGEKAILDISSDYAYGKEGFPGFINPNEDLIFEVQLNKIS